MHYQPDPEWIIEWEERYEKREQERRQWQREEQPLMANKPIKAPVRRKSPKGDRLREFLSAKKIETVVLGDVSRHLQTQPDVRDTTLIHPSEMAKKDWCQRSTLLRLKKYTRPKQVHNLRTELIFAEGRSIHEKWQTWFADMGILYGSWFCIACETRSLCEVLELPKSGCEGTVHGLHLWRYREVPLENALHGIGGHADGIITRPDQDYLFEAKSIGPGTLRKLNLLNEEEADEDSVDKFNRINYVLGDHYRQTQIYLRLTQDTDRPVNKGLIVYEHKADQQVREFTVDYDVDTTTKLFDIAADIQWAFHQDRDLACSNDPRGDCNECRGWEPPA